MLEGVNSEDKEMVTTVKGVIKAVLDGVKVCRREVVLVRDLEQPPAGCSSQKNSFQSLVG